jgi:hypothetical protein
MQNSPEKKYEDEVLSFPTRDADASAVTKLTSAVTRLIARLNGSPQFKPFVDQVYSPILAIVRDIPLTEIPQDLVPGRDHQHSLDSADAQAILTLTNQRTAENRRLLKATVALFLVFDIPTEASILRYQKGADPSFFSQLSSAIAAAKDYFDQTREQLFTPKDRRFLEATLKEIGARINRSPTAENITSFFVLHLWMLLDNLYRKRNPRQALHMAHLLHAWLDETDGATEPIIVRRDTHPTPPPAPMLPAERLVAVPSPLPSLDESVTLILPPEHETDDDFSTLILSADYEKQLFRLIKQYQLPRRMLDKKLVLRYINPGGTTSSQGRKPPVVLIYLRQSLATSYTNITKAINQCNASGKTLKLDTTLALLYIANELILRSQFAHANTVIMMIEWYTRGRIVLPEIERQIRLPSKPAKP